MSNPFYAAAALDDPFAPVKCAGCKKDIFGQSDKVSALKQFWHKQCLKCSVCGFLLNARNLESYQNIPYCKSHKPDPKATQTADRADIKQATSAPKATRRVQGVNKNSRMTFAPGAFQRPEGKIVKGFTEQRATMPPQKPVQNYDVNSNFGATYDVEPTANDQGYDQGASYDQGYDQGASYDQGYDQSYDQDNQGYDEGGYYEEGGEYQEGAYEEGYDEGYYEEGYEEGYYEEGNDGY